MNVNDNSCHDEVPTYPEMGQARWIPVSEALPEVGVLVLFLTIKGRMYAGSRASADTWVGAGLLFDDTDIAFWQLAPSRELSSSDKKTTKPAKVLVDRAVLEKVLDDHKTTRFEMFNTGGVNDEYQVCSSCNEVMPGMHLRDCPVSELRYSLALGREYQKFLERFERFVGDTLNDLEFSQAQARKRLFAEREYIRSQLDEARL